MYDLHIYEDVDAITITLETFKLEDGSQLTQKEKDFIKEVFEDDWDIYEAFAALRDL